MAYTPINEVVPYVQYIAAVGATDFDGGWWISRTEDLSVFKDGVEQTTGYSITGLQEPTGFTVVFDTPMVGGEIITLAGDFDIQRLTGYLSGGSFRANSLNLELSTVMAILLQLQRNIDRKIGFSITQSITSPVPAMPTPVDNVIPVWDGTTGLMKNGPTTTDLANAETYANSASASASAAAASYDSFDDRYLGSKSADPTLDNDGAALLTGALYWNSSAKEMRVYDGASWQVAYNGAYYTAPYTGAVQRTYAGKFKDVVSIEDFSSSYSSSADHTTLVQAAIDAVTNETVPPCLMVGNRRWNVGNIKCKTGLTLVGGGVGSGYFYLVNGTNNHMFTLDSDSVRSVQLKDFLINGNQANNSSGNGIFFNYTVAPSNNAKIRVENIHVSNAPEDSFGFGYGAGRDSWVRNCNSYFAGRYGMRMAAADMMVDGFNAGQSGNSGIIISSSGVHMSNVKAWLSGRLTTGSGNGVGICVDSTADVKGVQLNNLWTQENIGEAALLLFSHGTSILSGVTVNGLHSENDNGAIVKLVSGSGGYNRYNSIKNVSYGDSGLSQDPENFVVFNGSGTKQNYVELVKTDWSAFTSTDIVSVSVGAVNGANQFDIVGRPPSVDNAYAESFTPDVFSCAYDRMTLTGNVTINNMSSSRMRAGLRYRFKFTQDATGGRTVTFGTQYKTNWTPSTTANKINSIEFVCDGTNWIQQSATVGM